ncbi:MAG TPA: HAD hydrolase family protein [Hanamia sp.]
MHILSRLKMIKTFVFDMDGVLTDGSILVDHNNNWLRQMNIRDGYALQLASSEGFGIIVISGSDSPQVLDRLHKLGITEVFMKVKNKQQFLRDFAKERKIDLSEVLFMGDDIPDLICLQLAGVGACPADAASEIKEIASYISSYEGGKGCVRDVIEKVLKLNHKWSLQNNIPST